MSDDDSGGLGRESLKAERERLRAATERALVDERWHRPRPWLDWPLLVLFIAFMAVLFAPLSSSVRSIPALEAIAPETVRAERNVLVEDTEATALRRQQAMADVRPIFDFNPELLFARRRQVVGALEELKARAAAGELGVVERRAAFAADLGQPVNAKVFELIEGLSRPEDVAAAFNFFLNMGLDRMIVADRATLPSSGGIEARRGGLEEAEIVTHLGRVLALQQMRRQMRARASYAPFGEAKIVRTWVLETALTLVSTNLVLNEALTESARSAAAAAVEPAYLRINRGEVIVREGDRVAAGVRARLRALNEANTGRLVWVDSVAFAALLAGLVGLGAFFFRRGREPLNLSRKAGYVTLFTVALTSLVCVAALHAGSGIAEGFAFDSQAAAYLSPVALSAVLVSLLVNARVSLLVGVGLSLLMAYRADGDIWLVAYYLIGVLVAGIIARRCRHRSDLLKVGFAVALAQAATVPAVVVLSGGTIGPDHLAGVAYALASGAVVAGAAMALLPVLEYLFSETTDVRLMELASGDNKLLKDLALHAPGTYHHSVMMGNLAEAAADAIGANALQCRVMALYHDIGKGVRPVYFGENQRDGNIHDRLQPELSARLIFAHIGDGIELARKHRLGRPIIDAITQHQGTTLLKTFYLAAVERGRSSGVAVDEEDFRYTGPRPKSREAGVLMLADSIEAATRALKTPSPAEVQDRVHQVIDERIADGQLDDSPLTMRDLSTIEAVFTRVLVMGVYHSRIEYPVVYDSAAAHDSRRGHERSGDRRRHHRRDVAL